MHVCPECQGLGDIASEKAQLFQVIVEVQVEEAIETIQIQIVAMTPDSANSCAREYIRVRKMGQWRRRLMTQRLWSVDGISDQVCSPAKFSMDWIEKQLIKSGVIPRDTITEFSPKVPEKD